MLLKLLHCLLSMSTSFRLDLLNEQFLWSRFVNTHGQKGHNIPADLHMEHLNRLCKDAVSHLGANKTPHAIVRAGKAISVLGKVMQQFDSTSDVKHTSGFHTQRDMSGDLKKVLAEIHGKSQVFAHLPGRKHRSFPYVKCNIFRSIDQKKLQIWMKEKFSTQLKSSTLNK